jgi:hypothetical protein
MELDNLEAALGHFVFDSLSTSTFKTESQIAALQKVTDAVLASGVAAPVRAAEKRGRALALRHLVRDLSVGKAKR